MNKRIIPTSYIPIGEGVGRLEEQSQNCCFEKLNVNFMELLSNATTDGYAGPLSSVAENQDVSICERINQKSPPEELGAGVSSEPRSSKSTRGAAAGLATPFGREGPCEVEMPGGTEPAFLPLVELNSSLLKFKYKISLILNNNVIYPPIEETNIQ
nr:hypothetical protein Iba_chr09eCG5340 [Ipomoea batatas]